MKQLVFTGTWKLDVIVGEKSGVATFALVEGEDGNLGGTYSGQLGSAVVSGTVHGAEVEFSFDWHGGKVTYNGVCDGSRLSGTCAYGSAGTGTFEGRKTSG